MNINVKNNKKRLKYLSFLGFLGFLGFKYFHTKNLGDLYYFVNFVWFSNFFLSKINSEITDEMYLENMIKAKLLSGSVARVSLILLMLISLFLPKVSLIPYICLAFALSILSYGIKFYLLER